MASTARYLAVDLLLDPATVLAASQRRVLPPVTVVLDRDDDVRFTAAALAAHRPRAGTITVHPTVGTARTVVLLHDHLTALGRSVAGLRAQGLTREVQAEHAVRVWMWTEAVRHVIVLRSHLRVDLNYLLDLHTATGAALTLVWHTPTLGDDLQLLLNSLDHRVVDTLDAAREAFHHPLERCPSPGHRAPSRTCCAMDGVPAPPQSGGGAPVAGSPSSAMVDTIRRHGVHPVYAGALAAQWVTGAEVSRLRGVRLQDLAHDAAALSLPPALCDVPGGIRSGGAYETFTVPECLRAPLLAAGHHRRLEGPGPQSRLFGALRTDALSALARRCALRIPEGAAPRPAGVHEDRRGTGTGSP
ncbi:hypothetical protein [Kitasatospora putterlickiae]|uniref:hypothetical protein n=1 Tax=Kitasatospora putterlickiae TaxID=221725 RepID=UPI0031D3233C